MMFLYILAQGAYTEEQVYSWNAIYYIAVKSMQPTLPFTLQHQTLHFLCSCTKLKRVHSSKKGPSLIAWLRMFFHLKPDKRCSVSEVLAYMQEDTISAKNSFPQWLVWLKWNDYTQLCLNRNRSASTEHGSQLRNKGSIQYHTTTIWTSTRLHHAMFLCFKRRALCWAHAS